MKTNFLLLAVTGLTMMVCSLQAQNSISTNDELDNLDRIAEMDAKQYFHSGAKEDSSSQIEAAYVNARYHSFTGTFKDIYAGEFLSVLDSLVDGTYRAPATPAAATVAIIKSAPTFQPTPAPIISNYVGAPFVRVIFGLVMFCASTGCAIRRFCVEICRIQFRQTSRERKHRLLFSFSWKVSSDLTRSEKGDQVCEGCGNSLAKLDGFSDLHVAILPTPEYWLVPCGWSTSFDHLPTTLRPRTFEYRVPKSCGAKIGTYSGWPVFRAWEKFFQPRQRLTITHGPIR